MKRTDDIIGLKGIGEKTAKLFYKLNIHTVDDLLCHFPRDYEMFGEPVKIADAPLSVPVTLELTISGAFKWKKVRQLTVGSGIATDGTDKVAITYFNTPYLKNVLRGGGVYLFRGKLKKERDRYLLDQPKIYSYEEYGKKTGSLQPCYSLTAGLTNNALTKAMKQAVLLAGEEEYLPADIVEEYGLVSREQAFNAIHFPKDYESMVEARKRLCFDEFFLFLISLVIIP